MSQSVTKTIYYFTDRPLAGKSAHGIARRAMAIALASLDEVKQVNFFYLERPGQVNESGFDYHQSPNAKVVFRPVKIYFYQEELYSYKDKLMRFFIVNPQIILKFFYTFLKEAWGSDTVIFVRGEKALLVAYLTSLVKKFFYAGEVHNYEFGVKSVRDFFYKKIFRAARFMVTISVYTKTNWVEHGLAENKIMVLPSGVDLSAFTAVRDTKSDLRQKLHLPVDKKIVMYCGQLLFWKGIETLIESFRYQPAAETVLLIIGGAEEDVRKYKNYTQRLQLNNVYFLGHRPPGLIPQYLKAADVLVLPSTAKYSISRLHTSPIKLFEYLAAQTPIIVADLPSLRQFVTAEEVTFFQPDNPQDLGQQIAEVLSGGELIKSKVAVAYEKVKKYTWNKRAQKIAEELIK
jgi:glycosyltransferase involved in cell wall biosynthesis